MLPWAGVLFHSCVSYAHPSILKLENTALRRGIFLHTQRYGLRLTTSCLLPLIFRVAHATSLLCIYNPAANNVRRHLPVRVLFGLFPKHYKFSQTQGWQARLAARTRARAPISPSITTIFSLLPCLSPPSPPGQVQAEAPTRQRNLPQGPCPVL